LNPKRVFVSGARSKRLSNIVVPTSSTHPNFCRESSHDSRTWAVDAKLRSFNILERWRLLEVMPNEEKN
jgi:hypothetical protein